MPLLKHFWTMGGPCSFGLGALGKETANPAEKRPKRHPGGQQALRKRSGLLPARNWGFVAPTIFDLSVRGSPKLEKSGLPIKGEPRCEPRPQEVKAVLRNTPEDLLTLFRSCWPFSRVHALHERRPTGVGRAVVAHVLGRRKSSTVCAAALGRSMPDDSGASPSLNS